MARTTGGEKARELGRVALDKLRGGKRTQFASSIRRIVEKGDATNVRYNFHIPTNLRVALEKIAKAENTTVSDLLREGAHLVIADRIA